MIFSLQSIALSILFYPGYNIIFVSEYYSMKSNLFFKDALKLRRPNAFHVMLKPAGPSCNLNCTYCYYLEKRKLYRDTRNFHMSEELLENFTRQFIEAHDIPVVTFTWQGGEPTLMGLDFFRKAIELQEKYRNGKKIENAFQTNGTRLDDDWCSFFHDNKILVGISIDGEEHNHDHYRKTFSGRPTFKRVMKGIELLHRHKVEFNTLSVVNSYNVHFALETYRFLKRIGSGFIQFLPVAERSCDDIGEDGLNLVSPGFAGVARVTEWSVGAGDFGDFLIAIFDEWVRRDVGKIFVQIFDASLAAWMGAFQSVCIFSPTCGTALAMEHNGDLYSCDHFVDRDHLLGNIERVSMEKLASSEKQRRFGQDKLNSLPKYCLGCEVRFA